MNFFLWIAKDTSGYMVKKVINLCEKENPGQFVKPCPGTPDHVCCGYEIINFAQGCTLGCSYCILNAYFEDTAVLPVLFTNRDKLFEELQNTLQNKDRLFRFGTGEFTDSLLFEAQSPLYEMLVPYIASTHNAVLEIKTKTVNIKRLLGIKDHDNTIISWSLNSDFIARTQERNAPDIERRIDAAVQVTQEGYRLALHFDPIIMHGDWEDGYKRVVDRLFSRIQPEHLVYISMGALRFIPAMRVHMIRSHAEYIYDGEFIRGQDNKMRYFRPLRTRMYIVLKNFLTQYIDEGRLYMCMESSEVWEDVFGLSSMTTAELSNRLDRACYTKFSRLDSRVATSRPSIKQ